ncbi:hypothetical protein RND71_004595 [Anisodus tanguticus]|uniref:ATP synthase gamma chain, chloroplastic n=1 Tax=Anisodus tanguticus TaxID=243964 RepID=A0AAE1SMD9_9SOLA|nr:hypothetical protein RND71_004595 [Anisodus tanguticus]
MASPLCVPSKNPISNSSSSLSFTSQLLKFPISNINFTFQSSQQPLPSIYSGIRELRERIDTIKNIQKVTEAMKLVAAAKIRKAQESVISGKPFAETLVDFLYNISQQLQLEDVEIPLTEIRPIKKVALVVITGERGLSGGFNSEIIKKAETRMAELMNLGVEYALISVGKKGNAYFRRRKDKNVDRFVEGESFPTVKEAQVIADDVFSLFVSEDVDKVELLYTKFVSFIKSDPVIHTLLPLGSVFNVNGKSVDVDEDEFFKLTTKGGKLVVERDHLRVKKGTFVQNLEFEQDPAQILDALMPLYLNSQILRALQESFASELAARMNAMSSATDNAVELRRNLSVAYNRERQAKITGEILEIVAGAEALT